MEKLAELWQINCQQIPTAGGCRNSRAEPAASGRAEGCVVVGLRSVARSLPDAGQVVPNQHTRAPLTIFSL